MKRAMLAALAVVFCTAAASAQQWPTAPVRIVVPFGVGSTPDFVARTIADYLHDKSQVPFIVENKPGASGNTGTDAVAKAAPDGSTIGISIGGPLAINTLLFGNLPYDPKKDLTLITMLVTQPSALAVNTSLGVDTTRELIDLIARNPGKYAYGSIGTGSLSQLAMEAIALKKGTQLVHVPYSSSPQAMAALIRKNPGKYNYGSIGTGSLSQLAMEAIALKSGTRLVHVPFPSSPQAVEALIRNDVQMVCLPAVSITPQLAGGKIKLLAISTAKRSELLPGVPTL
ncbi:MAG: tripartite tricarboxylate transporter substrate binding protein, partial [Xanthobacteraceae bacterium]